MVKLSALVNTYNEAANIGDCLENLHWVDEIIVVDMESTDGTADIARQFTNKVFIVPPGNFSELRNTGLKKVSGDWVLQINADERVSTALADETQSTLSSEPALEDGFYIIKRRLFRRSHGLILSYLQSVYVFLRTAKAWLGYREQQSREKVK